MRTLLERSLSTSSPPSVVWAHLACVEDWPSWACHIKAVTLQPPGPLGPQSSGAFRLQGGLSTTFAMTEFSPPTNWAWQGPFLWLTVDYDHRFTERPDGGTDVHLVVAAEGWGSAVLGPLFAKIYSRNLDRGIPLLRAELEAL